MAEAAQIRRSMILDNCRFISEQALAATSTAASPLQQAKLLRSALDSVQASLALLLVECLLRGFDPEKIADAFLLTPEQVAEFQRAQAAL